ncbi:MAG: RES family NAD+ phosphorylase [Gammaproteobacteria bacterium]|nr:RES family NAD+ phosphorylase [Gammaproteobacteria bacterium]
MRLYRIGRLEHLEDFRGLGASYRDGGRWNRAGNPVLYFAETASVAMLEMANYLPSPRLVPSSYRLGIYELPDDTSMVRWPVSMLPPDWRDFPYPNSTQQMGTDWLGGGESHLLAVPSVAVPAGLDAIVLASPARMDPGAIRLIGVEAEIYNPRAFAR